MLTSSRNISLPVVSVVLLSATCGFVVGLQYSFGIVLRHQLGLSVWQSQLGAAASFTAMALMCLYRDKLARAKGPRYTTLTAALTAMAGVALMTASTLLAAPGAVLALYLPGAFMAGAASVMPDTAYSALISRGDPGADRMQYRWMQLSSLSSLVDTVCPVCVGYLIGNNLSGAELPEVRPALLVPMGVLVAVTVMLAMAKFPADDATESGDESESSSRWRKTSVTDLLGNSSLIMGLIAHFASLGVNVCIPVYVNYYMVFELDMSPAVAGSITALYWLVKLAGNFTSTALFGKLRLRTLVRASSLTALALLLGALLVSPDTQVTIAGLPATLRSFEFVQVPLSVVLLLLCGVCVPSMNYMVFDNIISQSLQFKALNFMLLGGAVLPLLQGAVAGAGGYVLSFVVPAAGVVLVVIYGLRFIQSWY